MSQAFFHARANKNHKKSVKKNIDKLARANYSGPQMEKKSENPDTQQPLSASLEDYLEAIYNLQADGNPARSKDIADKLDVSRASVTGALKLLSDKGMVNYKPYDTITLTDDGQDAAAQVARRHEVLKYFLTDILGVEPRAAQIAACKTEHTLGQQAFNRLVDFTEFIKARQRQGQDLAGQFKAFSESSKAKKDANRRSKHG